MRETRGIITRCFMRRRDVTGGLSQPSHTFFFGHVKKFKLHKSSSGDRSCSSSPLQTRDAQSILPQRAALHARHQLGLYEVKKFLSVGRGDGRQGKSEG